MPSGTFFAARAVDEGHLGVCFSSAPDGTWRPQVGDKREHICFSWTPILRLADRSALLPVSAWHPGRGPYGRTLMIDLPLRRSAAGLRRRRQARGRTLPMVSSAVVRPRTRWTFSLIGHIVHSTTKSARQASRAAPRQSHDGHHVPPVESAYGPLRRFAADARRKTRSHPADGLPSLSLESTNSCARRRSPSDVGGASGADHVRRHHVRAAVVDRLRGPRRARDLRPAEGGRANIPATRSGRRFWHCSRPTVKSTFAPGTARGCVLVSATYSLGQTSVPSDKIQSRGRTPAVPPTTRRCHNPRSGPTSEPPAHARIERGSVTV